MATYNPGEATVPVKIGAGRYSIDSFRGQAAAYEVTITPTGCRCSCPHYTARLAGTDGQCKHIVACLEIEASQPKPFGEVTPFVPLTAEQEAEEVEMVKLFGPTMWGVMLDSWSEAERQAAIRKARAELNPPTQLERAATVAQTLSDADLKRYAAERVGTAAGCACLLALAARAVAAQPKPIPAGVECFLVGATEAERERALAVYS